MKYLFILLILASCHNRKVETVKLQIVPDSVLFKDFVEDTTPPKFDTIHLGKGVLSTGMVQCSDGKGGTYWDYPPRIEVKLDTQAILKDTFFINHILDKYCISYKNVIVSYNRKFYNHEQYKDYPKKNH